MTTPFTVHDVQRLGRSIDSVIRPTSIKEAVRALELDPSARPIAGGTDLLLDLQRGGPGDPAVLVDVTTIDGFRTIEDAGDSWVLAGGVTHNQVVMHDGIAETALPLAQACLEVGSPQLRNRATIAGNLATASPANDTLSALIALRASIELTRSVDRSVTMRMLEVDEFFTGFRATALQPGELITAIRVPKLGGSERGIWVKLGLRKAQAISVVHAGMVVGFDGDTVVSARLALGSVAATVITIDAFADALIGRPLDNTTIADAASASSSAVAPITDGRATAAYRSDAVQMLVGRGLEAIAAGTHRSMWPVNPPTLSSSEELEAVAPSPTSNIDPSAPITIELNGSEISSPRATRTLLDWVRDEAGATGMKEGCAEGECGACTMLLDGSAVMSCLVTAAQADGRSVTTIEGIEHPLQNTFVDDFAVQCGFCIPGFIVSGTRLLDENDSPDDEQIKLALSGNLCRCTGYYPILEAVRDAAVIVRGRHG